MLEDFIETNEINAEIMTFDEEVRTGDQANRAMGAFPVVKSLIFTHEGDFVMVILEGKKHVDKEKLRAELGIPSIRMANPQEVEEATGYVAGGVPPISVYGMPTLIDAGVLEHAWVIAGGGTPNTLLKIQSKDILEYAFEGKIVHIAQEK